MVAGIKVTCAIEKKMGLESSTINKEATIKDYGTIIK